MYVWLLLAKVAVGIGRALAECIEALDTKRPKLFRAWLLLSAVWAGFLVIEGLPELPAILLPPLVVLILFYASTWVWERFGAANWSSLSANVRRGVLRLYAAIAIPWILWFTYLIDYDFEHYLRHRYIRGDFIALLTVPLGAMVLFMVGGWIVEGFRPRRVERTARPEEVNEENWKKMHLPPWGGF